MDTHYSCTLFCREKSERRCLNSSAPTLVTSSGVARVPPTSHMGPVQAGRGGHAAGAEGSQLGRP